LTCPFVSRAQTTGFQLSLFPPIQLHPADYSVDGFRLDLIDGVNKDVQGIDLGVITGVQIGILNFNDDTRYLGFFPFINAAF
jgi:hypothetical protein